MNEYNLNSFKWPNIFFSIYLLAAPTRFDITGCSHCSITVEWYNKDPNDHQYELVYRQESKDWVVLTLSKLEIQAEEIGHYKYTLQNLLPEAGYEMKLCSITNNIKSQYSDSKRKDTLKLGMKLFVPNLNVSSTIWHVAISANQDITL